VVHVNLLTAMAVTNVYALLVLAARDVKIVRMLHVFIHLEIDTVLE
jgi:hypothetical protein